MWFVYNRLVPSEPAQLYPEYDDAFQAWFLKAADKALKHWNSEYGLGDIKTVSEDMFRLGQIEGMATMSMMLKANGANTSAKNAAEFRATHFVVLKRMAAEFIGKMIDKHPECKEFNDSLKEEK